jgi:hypothetical protein
MMKHCPKCSQEKPFEAFYSSNRHKSGYAAWCKQCESERNRLKNLSNRASRLVKAKQWRDENKDKQAVAIKNWREQNPEKLKATYKDWAQRNKDKVNAKWMKREASKKQRTPAWLTEDDMWMMEQAYEIAAKRKQMLGDDWHVDHIIPLQGKTVSGLHVPWNLQVIPAKLNWQKSNHF